jgi:hypothetical protein
LERLRERFGESLLCGVRRDAELSRDRSRERARQFRDDVAERVAPVELCLDGANQRVGRGRRACVRRRGLPGEQRGDRAELGLEERTVA